MPYVCADRDLGCPPGAQYDCGTTDITRTMHFGTPSEHQKRCFTAVLKGHIALDSCVAAASMPCDTVLDAAQTPGTVFKLT